FRLASLRQQQRSEIMKNLSVRVNKNFELSFSLTTLEAFDHPLQAPRRNRPLPSVSFAFVESRRNRILVIEITLRK
ncbi:MAG: hypothetical protein CBHOC_3856, partial [uncultured Caballeronia sp.]